MDLYLKFMRLHFKSETQYKVSFILSSLSQFLVFFSYYFTVLCLFDKFSNIRGFTLYEVLLTFAIIHFGFSFCETFFRGVDTFDNLIVDGTFDRLLLRPRSILLQVFANDVSFVKMSRLLQSIIILIVAVIKIDIVWSIDKIVALMFMLISSVLVFLSIFILAASYCFLTLKGLEVRNVFTDGGKHMAQYPIGIFKKGFVFFFTYIIPFGFVNYYPLLYLIGDNTNKIFVFCPLVTILYLIPSVLIFYRGVKKYSSAGS